MSTLRELIMQEIQAVLVAASALAGVTIHRNLDEPLEEAKFPALAFAWTDDDIAQRQGRIDWHQLTVQLQAGAMGDTPDDSADTLLANACDALLATKGLNGKAKTVVVGSSQRDSELRNKAVSRITQFFTIQYTATTGSLTEPAG
jgi:hypothetical protein